MPPRPSNSAPRSPGEFARLLATPEPVLLVGGQAVNLWALYYKDRTQDLAPFVSRDVDVLGDRETLELLGRLSGTKPQFFPLRPPSNEIGVIVARDSTGAPLLVEVLRYVHGVTNEVLRAPVYRVAMGEPPVQVRIPGPIALLQAKLANLADIRQTSRQDGRHVVILARVLPVYLSDLRAAVTADRMTERKLVEFLEQLLAVVTAPNGRKGFAALRINPREVFAGVEGANLPKVGAFLRQRLPRSLPPS